MRKLSCNSNARVGKGDALSHGLADSWNDLERSDVWVIPAAICGSELLATQACKNACQAAGIQDTPNSRCGVKAHLKELNAGTRNPPTNAIIRRGPPPAACIDLGKSPPQSNAEPMPMPSPCPRPSKTSLHPRRRSHHTSALTTGLAVGVDADGVSTSTPPPPSRGRGGAVRGTAVLAVGSWNTSQ